MSVMKKASTLRQTEIKYETVKELKSGRNLEFLNRCDLVYAVVNDMFFFEFINKNPIFKEHAEEKYYKLF